MKFIGYLVIFWSALNLLINITRLLAVWRMKRNIREGLGSEAKAYVNAAYAGLAEYDWGMVVLSLGALPIGFFIAFNGATFWQLVGFVLLLMSLGGIVQSFRPSETAWIHRTISAIELVIGLYLIT